MPLLAISSNRIGHRRTLRPQVAVLGWMSLICVRLFTGWAMADDDAPVRLPIPNAEARRAADKQVRDIFQTEFAAAKRPAEKFTLAEMLFRHAQNDGDDAVAQYALFDAARALAIEADEFQLTFSVIDELVARFELDKCELKAAALTAGSKELRSVIAQRGFCELIVESVDDAASEEQFDAATKLVPLLSASASKIKDASVRKEFLARHSELKQLQTQWAAIAKAKSALEKTPDDEVANGTYGRYLCLLAGNWEKGLPILAKGTDPTLSKAAQQELKEQITPEERLGLADVWWTVGQAESGIAKQNLLLQAKVNYEKAANELKGLSRTKADQRVDVITKLYPNEVQRQVQNARGKTFGDLKANGQSVTKPTSPNKPIGKTTSRPKNGNEASKSEGIDRDVAQRLKSIKGQCTIGIKPVGTENMTFLSQKSPLPETPFLITHLGFYSRNMGRDDLSKADFQQMAKLSGLENVFANGIEIPETFWLNSLSLNSLQQLHLVGAGASDTTIAALGKPLRLRGLDVSDSAVSDVSLERIAAYPALDSLGVNRTRVTGKGLKMLSQSSLTQLKAESLGLKDADLEAIAGMSRLESLLLADETFTGEGFQSFKGRCPLKQLHLQNVRLTAAGVERIAEISTLQSLTLRQSEVNAPLVKVLSERARLQTLNFHESIIPEAALSSLASSPVLKHLILWGTKITGAGFKGHVPQLTVSQLNVMQTPVNDAGLANIARAFPNLTSLSLDETAITDEGLKHLRSLTSLNHLGLGRTRVTAKGLAGLAVLPKLNQLYIPRSVSPAEVKTLLPQCRNVIPYHE